LHLAQLMPLPLTVSCFSKIHIGSTFLVPADLGSPEKGLLNVCVCVCVCGRDSHRSIESQIGNLTVPVGFDSYPDFLAMALLLVVTLLVSVGVKVITSVVFH